MRKALDLVSTFRVNRGKLLPVEDTTLDRAILCTDKCYLLDCDAKLYLWMGKNAIPSEKKACITSVEVSFHKCNDFRFCQYSKFLVGTEHGC